MLRPTDILSQEHRVIEQVLSALEEMVRHCQTTGKLNVEDGRKAVAFLRAFADECHHGKEENHLFPAMEAKGYPRHGGPTGVMLHEHDEGRHLVVAMDQALGAAGDGAAEACERFALNARKYIDLLREHIRKEDHCLFTMAKQALSDAEQQQLLQAFSDVETHHMGAGTHEKFVALADELADRYGTAKATHGHTCGCGH